MLPFFDSSRHERFFVKSLENVQGDERDTMIISVGYGKDSNGGLSYNFGPINTDGGWRRLNVLVTRAKWETILVTSLRSQELNGINPGNRGAVSLRNFIEFAERNATLPAEEPTLTQGETNDFEDAVREALVDRGFIVDQQVGASRYRIDLAIRDSRDPSRYLLGVECDGATYHSSRTARDRDILRQEVLQSMGWHLHRVWSTEWFHDRERAMQSLLKSIEQVATLAPDHVVHAPVPSDQGGTIAGSVPDEHQEHASIPHEQVSRRYMPGEPYSRYPVQRHQHKDYVLEGKFVRTLAGTVAEIVAIEGPIHEDLLVDRLKEVHGIERAGSNVQANVKQAVAHAGFSNGIERSESNRQFIVKRGGPAKTFRVPGQGVKRPLELICLEEIEFCILYLVEDQFGMMRDQIPQSVARLFGVERLRADSADIIRIAVDDLVDRNLLRASGPQVYLA